MQTRAKSGSILYDRGGKSSTHYPDLEPGNEFGNRVRVLISGYKLLIYVVYVHVPCLCSAYRISRKCAYFSSVSHSGRSGD